MQQTIKQELVNLIKDRRSITFFDPSKEIPDQTLEELINLSSTAPSGYNLQPWKIIIVKDKQKKSVLKEICFNQQKVEDASANIVVLANTKGGIENVDRVLDNWIELGYINPDQKDPIKQSIINSWSDTERAKKKSIRDSAMFSMNIMICARIFGLETHPMEGFDEQKLREFLNIPDHMIPIMIIAIGYKDKTKELLPRAYRFNFQEISQLI
ncbi:MAG: nitroreductase family protein [Candidatus Calescibacterium sp.]|nr:nitroreductase family protein [Candidatus Calescibacterium sp.]MDW8132495.1 nitroreductase family protein [Candidatus Calescibacterium sp.]